MMNCRRAESLLSAYLDGELNGEDMLELRSHVHSCSRCEAGLEAEKELRRILGSLPDVPCPTGLEDRLANALFAPPAPRLDWRQMSMFGAAAAAAAACAFVVFRQISSHPQSIVVQEPRQSRSMDIAFTDGRDSMGVYVPLVPVSHMDGREKP